MSLTNKSPSETYKDLLYVDNSNSGVDATTRSIKTGSGSQTSFSVSDRAMNVKSLTNNTAAFSVSNSGGTSKFLVDTTNNYVKANGVHVNTQYKELGIFDFSPAAGYHYPLIAMNGMYSSSGSNYSAYVNSSAWGSNGENPATSLTLASVAEQLVPSVWVLIDNIYIDAVHYDVSCDGASTANIHLMSYDYVTGSGSTAGDLSNGAVLGQTGSATDNLSPVTVGDDRISNGTLTLNTQSVASGKTIVGFVENVGGTDDITLKLILKYHITS